jgi:ribonuclease P protein component
VLPASARLRRRADFRLVLRRGTKAGRRRLVVHALTGRPHPGVQAGFVVSKAVGNSVVRHRVSRRLRHLIAQRMGTMPAGSALVVRALPASASASSAELAADLDGALQRLRLAGAPQRAEAEGR